MRSHSLVTFILACHLCGSAQSAPQKAIPAKGRPIPAVKRLDIQLKDAELTPRALGSWQRSGQRNDLSFMVVSFERRVRAAKAPGLGNADIPSSSFVVDGVEVPIFELEARLALPEERSDRTRSEGLLRLTKRGAQMSIDGGIHWVTAEKQAGRSLFAFDNLTVSLFPMDESFQPSRFRAIAFERGVITHSTKDKVFPFFHSVVVLLAYGRNEVEGILKYPGTSFVVPFRGVQHGGTLIARSMSEAPFNVQVWRDQPGPQGALALQGGLYTQIEMNGRRLLLGTGSFLNYGLGGESSEQLGTALEYELNQGKELPGLAEAYKANFGRSIWTKTDEASSFSREAEKAYVAEGLKTWLWAPLTEPESSGYSGYSHRAHNSFDPIAQRIREMGGVMGLLDPRGLPK